MNSYKYPPCCPLCPLVPQYDVHQLAGHLATIHQLGNSALILARAMCLSPQGYQDAGAILKDMCYVNKKFMRKCDQANKLDRDLKEETRLLAEVKVKLVKVTKAEQLSRADIKNTEQKDFEVKKTNENEDALRDKSIAEEKPIKPKDEMNEVPSSKSLHRNKLEIAKAVSSEKDEQIEKLANQLNELQYQIEVKERLMQSQLKLSRNEYKILSMEFDKLKKERENEENTSTMLIESQRSVHEKEIQDLNMKLQNQINRSQDLKLKVLNEVETFKAFTKKKNDQIESLKNQVNILQVKVTESSESFDNNNPDLNVCKEKLEEKNSEIYLLHEKIARLDSKVKLKHDLEKRVDHFKDLLFKQCKENLDIKHSLDIFKESSKETISERDKKIFCLEKELKSTRADSEIVMEEVERYSKERLSYEKTIADMKIKFGRYKEILELMKDSLSGLAAMNEDTSNNLIEAVKNTARASKLVNEDVRKRFKDLEKDVEMFEGKVMLNVDKESLTVDNEVDISIVKNEPEVANNSSEVKVNIFKNSTANSGDDCPSDGKKSKNAKNVAEDLSRQFDRHFSGRDGGKRSRQECGVKAESESERKNSSSKSVTKRRKFFE